jgi:energy-coupling factor transporter ATP-binding protein EcfA2
MAYNYSELASLAKNWLEQAVAENWLDAAQLNALLEIDPRSPSSLFSANLTGLSRPLIVAFMGGTGVGKSSLLNRLAGQAIAKSGIERPTSREVTLYHHHSVKISQLPEHLPLQKIKIAQHQDEQKKNLLWIDMPDFDSTEQSNKNLVLQWLPHIDVLIYVVSPERYRDNKAWQLLLSEGARHGWLFVMNQWDRGQAAQYEDFNQQLAKAGFHQPLIFRTICSEVAAQDDFQSLLATLESLANQHGVQQLESHGLKVKTALLKQQLQHCADSLNHLAQFQDLQHHWQQHWAEQEKQFNQGFAWGLQQFATRYARSNTDVMVKNQPLFLWDEWAQSRFNDVLDELVLTAGQLQIPALPLRARLLELRQNVGKNLHNQTELSCRQALIQPGNAMQRFLLKLTVLCEVLLPLFALSWVAYQVFHGYYESYTSSKAYLGVDFVAHSSLLVLISWLLPYFVTKKMQPSLEKTALKGLNKGLDLALAAIDSEVKQAIAAHHHQQQALLTQVNHYIAECDVNTESVKIVQKGALARMLVD